MNPTAGEAYILFLDELFAKACADALHGALQLPAILDEWQGATAMLSKQRAWTERLQDLDEGILADTLIAWSSWSSQVRRAAHA